MQIEKFPTQKFLVVYSGVLTFMLAVIVFCGYRAQKRARFDEITAQRINIVEPDGTLRLVISDRARYPGSYVKGKEIMRPDRNEAAGFLFIDDEGTEIGGQLWGGLTKDGEVASGGHLSFDRYNGDQTIVLDTGEEKGKGRTIIGINDSHGNIAEAFKAGRLLDALPADQKEAAYKKFNHDFPLTHRILLARDRDKSVVEYMNDVEGRHRIALKVDAEGNPSIELLNAKGKVISRLPAVD